MGGDRGIIQQEDEEAKSMLDDDLSRLIREYDQRYEELDNLAILEHYGIVVPTEDLAMNGRKEIREIENSEE